MKDLRRLRESDPGYPPVLFVFRDSLARGERFFAQEWPEARAIADPTGDWWRIFSLKPGPGLQLRKLFGPSVWKSAFRALAKGNLVGRPGKAPFSEPGMFLLDEHGQTLKRHDFAHIGDHPDFRAFPIV